MGEPGRSFVWRRSHRLRGNSNQSSVVGRRATTGLRSGYHYSYHYEPTFPPSSSGAWNRHAGFPAPLFAEKLDGWLAGEPAPSRHRRWTTRHPYGASTAAGVPVAGITILPEAPATARGQPGDAAEEDTLRPSLRFRARTIRFGSARGRPASSRRGAASVALVNGLCRGDDWWRPDGATPKCPPWIARRTA